MGTYLINLDAILKAGLEALAPLIVKCGIISDVSLLNVGDLEWEAWPQTWGSTALGYGGIGGQAMTHAQTVIVMANQFLDEAAVFFGGPRLAYIANRKSEWWQRAYDRREMPMRGCPKIEWPYDPEHCGPPTAAEMRRSKQVTPRPANGGGCR